MVIRKPGGLAFSAGLGCLLAAAPATPPAENRRELPVIEEQVLKLLTVRTIFVDELRGADGREQIRDMLIGSLQRSGLFIVTEDQEHADAYLRGSAEDLIVVEVHRQRDGIQVRGAVSGSDRDSEESEFRSSSFGVGDTDESYRREQKHEAMAAVRLVLRSGEVVWSTTQESSGAKYRGPAADVAEKVAKELQRAHARAREGARLKQGEPAKPGAKPAGR
jgi:hypothetical protein